MEVVKEGTPAVTVPMDKFPRLVAIRKSIDNLKSLVDFLNKRKEIITNSTDKISEYDANERSIVFMKTDIELAKVHTSIIHKEKDIKEYLDKVVFPIIGDIDNDWQGLLDKAKEKSKKDGTLAKVLEETDFSQFADNWEHKFNFYLAVKNYLYPNKAKVVQGLKKVK